MATIAEQLGLESCRFCRTSLSRRYLVRDDNGWHCKSRKQCVSRGLDLTGER